MLTDELTEFQHIILILEAQWIMEDRSFHIDLRKESGHISSETRVNMPRITIKNLVTRKLPN